MRSIEERAKEAGVISQYKSDYRYDKRSVEFGYTQGATEQKAIDIDKACKWLDRYLHLFVMKGHINHSALEQEFRKEMEE